MTWLYAAHPQLYSLYYHSIFRIFVYIWSVATEAAKEEEEDGEEDDDDMNNFESDDDEDGDDTDKEMGVDAEDGDEAESVKLHKLAARVGL